jgi:hypothetical protein
MEALTIEQIRVLQEQNGLTQLQLFVETGDAWITEGSIGRAAMEALESGACFLPDKVYFDAYGNKVPARSMLKAGSKGTLENSQNFWQGIEDGKIHIINDDDEGEEQ